MRTSPRGPHYSWTAHLLEATATAQHSAAAQLPGGTPSASYSSAQQSVVSHSKQERSVPFIRVNQHSKSQQTVYYLSDSVHFRLPLRKCRRDESREPANSAAALILASVITAQSTLSAKGSAGTATVTCSAGSLLQRSATTERKGGRVGTTGPSPEAGATCICITTITTA